MAPSDTDGNEGHQGQDGDDVREVLVAVQDSALKLLAGFPGPPSALRIQAGDVTVEATWPGPPDGAAPVARPAPTPTTGTAGTDGTDGTDSIGDLPAGQAHVCSPTVGTFYRAPEPGAAPFVEVGDTVRAGQQVAIVETMKLMIPVKADRGGTVVEVLKDDGESVEHGEPLFALAEPSS